MPVLQIHDTKEIAQIAAPMTSECGEFFVHLLLGGKSFNCDRPAGVCIHILQGFCTLPTCQT